VTRVQLLRHDLAKIERHGQEAYPEEACGFLLGPIPEPSGRGRAIVAVKRARNESEGERGRRFVIPPEELRSLEHRLDGSGRGVVGFYHSHPDHPARPSIFDQEHAWPWYTYLVTAVTSGVAGETAAFELDPERRVFGTVALEVRAPLAGGSVSKTL
jgi:proteasome lid subunit RPN8/RPN11